MNLSRFFLHYLPSGTQDSLKTASGLYRGRQRELLEKKPLKLVLRRRKDPPEASTAGREALRPLTSLAGGCQGLRGWGSTPLVTFLLSVLPSSPKAGFFAGSLQEIWVCKGPTFWLEDSKGEPQGGRRNNEMVHSGERGEGTLRVTQDSVVCAAPENALSPGCANTRISGSVSPLMCHQFPQQSALSCPWLGKRISRILRTLMRETGGFSLHSLPVFLSKPHSILSAFGLSSETPGPLTQRVTPTLMERWGRTPTRLRGTGRS